MNPSNEVRAARLSRLLSTCVIAGAVLYCIAETVLHVLRADYNPAQRFLSEYAVGRFGVLGTLAFCLLAVMAAAFTIRLRLAIRRSWPLVATCILMSVVSLGFCALGVFPTDLMDANGGAPPIRTSIGIVHDVCTSVLSGALALAALLLPWAFKRDLHWRAMSSKAFAVGIFIPLFLCIASASPPNWRGAGQRLAVASGLVWMVVISRLLSGSRTIESGSRGN